MNYNNENVRRQDRLLEEEKATNLLKNGVYGYLSMTEDNTPYGIPINYAWDGKNAIYLHCANEGKKLDILNKNSQTSFCVVGETKVAENKFTCYYESIILSCNAVIVNDEKEKIEALRLIGEKFCPQLMDKFSQSLERSISKTSIIRLDITSCSGKTKRL